MPIGSDPISTRAFIDELDALGFARLQYANSGEMTCSLAARSGEGWHRMTWPPDDPDAPAGIRDLARRIRALVDAPTDSEPVAAE